MVWIELLPCLVLSYTPWVILGEGEWERWMPSWRMTWEELRAKMGSEWKIVLRMQEDITKEGCLRNQHVIIHSIYIFLADHQLFLFHAWGTQPNLGQWLKGQQEQGGRSSAVKNKGHSIQQQHRLAFDASVITCKLHDLTSWCILLWRRRLLSLACGANGMWKRLEARLWACRK